MGTPHGRTVIEKFLAKVDRSAGPNGCWLWTAATQSKGYGVFSNRQQRRRPVPVADVGDWLAHRFAFERIGGHVIPDSTTVRHLCGQRLCVNPAHLTTDGAAA